MSDIPLDKGEINVKYVIIGIVAIISYVGWFYNSVIIPINTIQTTQSQILANLQQTSSSQTAQDIIIKQNSDDIIKIKERLKLP